MTDPSAENPPRRRTNYRQLFSFAVCCAMICWLIEYPIQPVFAAHNQNTLLIGDQSLVRDPYEILITPPSSLSGKTVEEILRLRVKAVWQQPLLIGINYRPAEAVFCRLRSGAAWRDWAGTELSAASEAVLNPYLLVAAKVETDANAAAGEFFPASLTWDPAQRQATVVYHFGEFAARAGSASNKPLTLDEWSLQLTVLNAADMNLNYAAVLPDEAQGLSLPAGLAEPVLIDQYLRFDPNCGEPGGCNEPTLPRPEFRGLRLETLPARMTVRLWKERPAAPTAAPEMRFVVEFR